MAKADPELRAHQEWIGYVQPVGLLVSPPALAAAGAHVNRNIAPVQQRLLGIVRDVEVPADDGSKDDGGKDDGSRNDGGREKAPTVGLEAFLRDVCGWEAEDLVRADGGTLADDGVSEALELPLPDHDDVLRPTWAVPGADEANPYLMLLQEHAPTVDLDAPVSNGWRASPHVRFERLLRERGVPIGVLANGRAIRLIYAPRGETSGYATFPVAQMTEVLGRPMLAALHMLLEAERLFVVAEAQRLPALLAESRRYQSHVSTQLADQCLRALNELLHGFQAANAATEGRLLGETLREAPNEVYAGLLSTLLRIVFVLYAEERGLLPGDAVFVNHYGIGGLFERLRSDRDHHPDTMDERHGAWAQLLALFRLIHDGGSHGKLQLPPRRGHLFDPDRYPFLEGRPRGMARQVNERTDVPRVSDGVVFRVLEDLMLLDGERISYRTLDVEQIGSVYETMMGFDLRLAEGRSIGIKSKKRHGAPTVLDLDHVLSLAAGERQKAIQEATDHRLEGKALKAAKDADSPEALVAALGKKVSVTTPRIVPPGAMILQPSEERRRSGSHYTPRTLTEPIVRTTLRPVLERLRDQAGGAPRPEQILGLKVCDPAMGSGAFLVEACRQLGDLLVEAWQTHGGAPPLPPDEDEVLLARRLVAKSCLYGVDKNPLATDLAKLSLWLVTLARDHAFTFVDHGLRTGDSLVGLTREQIQAFHWSPPRDRELIGVQIEERLDEARRLRQEIQNAGEETSEDELRALLTAADDRLEDARLLGDLVIRAFFAADKKKAREEKRTELAEAAKLMLAGDETERGRLLAEQEELREGGAHPLRPFHWQVEFPELWGEERAGFDCIVGNPPFAGKNSITATAGKGYLGWLKELHEDSHGNADLCAHFYRRAFDLISGEGTYGLIATNTIAQGDTRHTGLRWICTHGGTIYEATRRYKWPGIAAVVVSIVHVAKAEVPPPYRLDGKARDQITAFLFHGGGHESPKQLAANAGKCHQGSVLLGMGFTFDDTDKKGVANSLAEMERLIAKDPRNGDRIFPYIGGEEINTSPIQSHHRYVIDFGDMSLDEVKAWPALLRVVEDRVRPARSSSRGTRRTRWWQHAERAVGLYSSISSLKRALAVNCGATPHLSLTFLHTTYVYANTLDVFALEEWSAFAALQSRPHEIWARFFGSSMKDDLRYTPSDCFETFPFPENYESNEQLEAIGQRYYDFRAALMVEHDQGLTKTYNRFHDPDETDEGILELRRLHDEMDRAVLAAYDWSDLNPTCDFFLDYEDEEEDEPGKKRKKKKPWRYRWPDDTHDDILARLLELNQNRAEEERLAGNPKA